MGKLSGREVNLYKGATIGSGTLQAGGRTLNVTITNSEIDVTDKAAAGWQTFLADAGVRAIDVEFAGLMDGATLLALALGDDETLLRAQYYITLAGFGSISGPWYLSDLEISGEVEGAAEFTATFMSGASMTWTDA